MAARPSRSRIVGLDIARSLALLAMATYHFCYDLEAFGYLAPGTMVTGLGALSARIIASSFLFMVGISLWLAHGQGIRWRPFFWRLLQVAAAAALITLGSYFIYGPRLIFFGILHSIAISSLIGLAFLRLPVGLTALAAVMAFFAPSWLAGGSFNSLWLIWTGLTTLPVYAVDFVPTFPWLAPVLAGIAAAKLAGRLGLWDRMRTTPTPLLTRLGFLGRHGLVFYVLHQPVLVGLLSGLRKLGWF